MLRAGPAGDGAARAGRDRPLRRRHDDRDDDRRAAARRDRRGVRAGARPATRRRSSSARSRSSSALGLARRAGDRRAARRCSPRPTTTTGCSALTLAVTYLPVAFALQAPQWVFFKRMDYVRLRTLQAIVPLGTVAVTVPLLLAGVGVWALVIGPFCGNVAAIARRLARLAVPAAAAARPRRPRGATCASRGRCSSPRRSRCWSRRARSRCSGSRRARRRPAGSRWRRR